jgi:hypothetical protein
MPGSKTHKTHALHVHRSRSRRQIHQAAGRLRRGAPPVDTLVYGDEVVLLTIHAHAWFIDVVRWVRGADVPAVGLVGEEVLRCACTRGLGLDGVGCLAACVGLDAAPFPAAHHVSMF